jgi:hypothetical protein
VTDTYVHEDVATIRVTTTAGEVVTTVNHPFYVETKGYIPAGDLHAGDRLKTPDGDTVAVMTIQATGKTETVYNLNVTDVHNYHVAVGAASVLVHNDGPCDVVPDPDPVLKPNGKPDRTSEVYVNAFDQDGNVVTYGSQGRVHAEDVAQAANPGTQMSQPYAWRRNPATGEVEWTQFPVCPRCQENYAQDMFNPGTTFDPSGPWGTGS